MSNSESFPLALPAGTVLAGQYTIEKVLGQGGFGITYEATDHSSGRKVAVKEFFPDTLAYREMTTVISYPGDRSENFEYGKESFLQEAKTLAEFIGCDNVVRIYSYFEENGTAYFVMEYIEGTSFDDYIERNGGKISMEDAKRILIPIMDALAIVHSRGIVHRDVTPDNIYITNSGAVKLLDFGAARYSLGDKSRSLDVILKHGFAPKEQYTRRGKQGAFTDVYSLGATFYFAITGRRPPDSIDRIEEDELIPPSSLGVNITEYEETAILQAMEVQPNMRFQSMTAFKNIFLNETAAAPAPSAQPVQQHFFSAPTGQQPMGQPVGQTYQQPVVQTAEQSVGQTYSQQIGQTTGQTVGQTYWQPIDQTIGRATEQTESQTYQQPQKGGNKKILIASVATLAIIAAIFLPSLVKKSDTDISDADTKSTVSYNDDDDKSSSGRTGGGLADVTLTVPDSSAKNEETTTTAAPKADAASYTDLTPVGNNWGNIAGGGLVSYGKDGKSAYVDGDTNVLYYDLTTAFFGRGEISCVSYDSDNNVIYFLCGGHVWYYDTVNGESKYYEYLDKYLKSDGINRLYVTKDFFFIYSRDMNSSNGKLHRVSQHDFADVQSIDVGSENEFAILGDTLYKIEDDNKVIRTWSALDFTVKMKNKDGNNKLSYTDGNIVNITTDGIDIYTTTQINSDVCVVKIKSNLSIDNGWIITDSIKTMGDQYVNVGLPVFAGNRMFYTLNNVDYSSAVLCSTLLYADGTAGNTVSFTDVSEDKIWLKWAGIVDGNVEVAFIKNTGNSAYAKFDLSGNNIT